MTRPDETPSSPRGGDPDPDPDPTDVSWTGLDEDERPAAAADADDEPEAQAVAESEPEPEPSLDVEEGPPKSVPPPGSAPKEEEVAEPQARGLMAFLRRKR